MAKDLNVSVIAISQLKSVEMSDTKAHRPQMSDLRDSGSIEQDADTIIFIYRDEYYNPETTFSKDISEFIIAKQRNGPTGIVLTRFSASYARFDNVHENEYESHIDDSSPF